MRAQGSVTPGRLVLCLVAAMLLAGCRSELFGKLDESDANAVLDVLYAEGITARKLPGEGGAWRIEVDADEHQRALHVARWQGLPRERFATMGELFKKEGLVSTPSEERLRYIFAVSQELSSTLSQIDGVVSARVHPVIPANDPLADRVRPASAAVFIKHLPDADLQVMAPAIKTLVTRSIEGLAGDNVSLTFVVSKVSPRNTPDARDGVGSRSVVAALATLSVTATLAAALWWLLRWRRRRALIPVVGSTPLATPRREGA